MRSRNNNDIRLDSNKRILIIDFEYLQRFNENYRGAVYDVIIIDRYKMTQEMIDRAYALERLLYRDGQVVII